MNSEKNELLEKAREIVLPTLGWVGLFGLLATGLLLMGLSLVALLLFHADHFCGFALISGSLTSTVATALICHRLLATRAMR